MVKFYVPTWSIFAGSVTYYASIIVYMYMHIITWHAGSWGGSVTLHPWSRAMTGAKTSL